MRAGEANARVPMLEHTQILKQGAERRKLFRLFRFNTGRLRRALFFFVSQIS